MKLLKNCSEEEIKASSYNMYVYSVFILKNRLPNSLHEEMVEKNKKKDEFAIAYFSFLKKNKKSKLRKILGF